MNVVIITQARFGSTRLRGKVLKKINNETLLEIHLERLKKGQLVKDIVVATTHEEDASEILDIAKSKGCLSYRGSLNDVLDRFYQVALEVNAETIIRVTSDCPLIDAKLIDAMLVDFLKSDIDYLSNAHPPTYPDGLDVEIFSFEALKRAWENAKLPKEREHVTSYIWENPNIFKMQNYSNNTDMSQYRLTVDNIEDFELVSHLVASVGKLAPWKDYVDYLILNPELMKLNQHLKRNEGYYKEK